MRERGVRVVFSPESPRRPVAPHRRAHRTEDQSHSNGATNERASNAGRSARRRLAHAPAPKGDFAMHLRRRMPDEQRLKRIRTVFAVLADQQRLKILLALSAAEELCVCEVADVLGTSMSVASHHLRKLRDCGILEDRSDGKLAYYFLRQRYVASLAVTALGATRT